jgi:hypothetical protein
MNRTYQDRRNAPRPAPEEAREEPEAPAPDDRDEGRLPRRQLLNDGEILQRYEG